MTNDPVSEYLIVDTSVGRIARVKRFFAKHKTEFILGAALAASVTLNVVRKPFPEIEDAKWYALTKDDTEYLNRLLENDQEFQKFD